MAKKASTVTQFIKKTKRFTGNHVGDVIMVAGCAALVFGVSLISVAAAWIVGGLLGIGISILVEIGSKK